jgi:hypothetical protein
VSILGMSHARSVMTLYLVSAALGLTAIMLRDATLFQARLLLAGLAAAFVFALVWLEVKFKPVSGPAPTPESESAPD